MEADLDAEPRHPSLWRRYSCCRPGRRCNSRGRNRGRGGRDGYHPPAGHRQEGLPNVPGDGRTAVVVNLAPGGTSPSYRYPSFVVACVLSGTVRLELADGPAVDYHARESRVGRPASCTHSPATRAPPAAEPAPSSSRRRSRHAEQQQWHAFDARRPCPRVRPARGHHRRAPACRPAPGAGRSAGAGRRRRRGAPGTAGSGPARASLPQPAPAHPGLGPFGRGRGRGAPRSSAWSPGEEVYGVTNARFTGAYAEYALAEAARLAPEAGDAGPCPRRRRAGDRGHRLADAVRGTRASRRASGCSSYGGAGNVGAYAVQLARRAGARVIATAGAADLGCTLARPRGGQGDRFPRGICFEAAPGGEVDAVIDLVGGEVQERSLAILRPGTGVLVSAVSQPDQGQADRRGVRARFMLVDVTTAALAEIGRLLDAGELRAGKVGEVLPLEEAVRAHRMLEGEPTGAARSCSGWRPRDRRRWRCGRAARSGGPLSPPPQSRAPRGRPRPAARAGRAGG